jgi:hypothetical protein
MCSQTDDPTMHDAPDPYDAAIRYATDLGAYHGRSAAGWYIQDTIGGRVSGDPVKAAEYILRGIEDGDSAVTDGFPFADLSGEWADSLTGPSLVIESLNAAGVAHGEPDTTDLGDPMLAWDDDICGAYETAFDQAAESAIETAARDILA